MKAQGSEGACFRAVFEISGVEKKTKHYFVFLNNETCWLSEYISEDQKYCDAETNFQNK